MNELHHKTLNEHSGTVQAILWVIVTIGASIRLFLGSMSPPILGFLVIISCFAFIATLIWRLSHTDPAASDLPDLPPLIFPGLRFRDMVGYIIVSLVLLFFIGNVIHPYILMVIGFSLLSVRFITIWHNKLSVRLIVIGVAAGLVTGLITICLGEGDFSLAMLHIVTIPLMFIGGALLLSYSKLSRIHLSEGQYSRSLSSFLWACILALPAALLNVLGGPYVRDIWVDRWWEPLYALVPSIAEETVARLNLTTLCYVLIRPYTNDRPNRAVATAILIGAITHGLAHLSNSEIFSAEGIMMLLMGLIYGVPMALLFIKCDLEHAIGYHFFIDFVRYLAALFWL